MLAQPLRANVASATEAVSVVDIFFIWGSLSVGVVENVVHASLYSLRCVQLRLSYFVLFES
jgi:hypothetical protein